MGILACFGFILFLGVLFKIKPFWYQILMNCIWFSPRNCFFQFNETETRFLHSPAPGSKWFSPKIAGGDRHVNHPLYGTRLRHIQQEYGVQSTLCSIRLLGRKGFFKNIAIDMSDTVSVDQLWFTLMWASRLATHAHYSQAYAPSPCRDNNGNSTPAT